MFILCYTNVSGPWKSSPLSWAARFFHWFQLCLCHCRPPAGGYCSLVSGGLVSGRCVEEVRWNGDGLASLLKFVGAFLLFGESGGVSRYQDLWPCEEASGVEGLLVPDLGLAG